MVSENRCDRHINCNVWPQLPADWRYRDNHVLIQKARIVSGRRTPHPCADTRLHAEIERAIMDKLEGRLEADSSIGQMSEVTVTIGAKPLPLRVVMEKGLIEGLTSCRFGMAATIRRCAPNVVAALKLNDEGS